MLWVSSQKSNQSGERKIIQLNHYSHELHSCWQINQKWPKVFFFYRSKMSHLSQRFWCKNHCLRAVNHRIIVRNNVILRLLPRMAKLGIPPKLIRMYEDFLSDRRAYVHFKNFKISILLSIVYLCNRKYPAYI